MLLHRSSVFKVPHQGIEDWVLKSGWRVSFEFLIVSPLASITDFDPTSGLLFCSLMAHSTPQGTATVTHYIFELYTVIKWKGPTLVNRMVLHEENYCSKCERMILDTPHSHWVGGVGTEAEVILLVSC